VFSRSPELRLNNFIVRSVDADTRYLLLYVNRIDVINAVWPTIQINICQWILNECIPVNFFTSFFDGIWYIAMSLCRVVQKTCWLNVVGAILNTPSLHGNIVIVNGGIVEIHEESGTNTGVPQDSHHSCAWVYKDSICSL
jgi:hypothetical protein